MVNSMKYHINGNSDCTNDGQKHIFQGNWKVKENDLQHFNIDT